MNNVIQLQDVLILMDVIVRSMICFHNFFILQLMGISMKNIAACFGDEILNTH